MEGQEKGEIARKAENQANLVSDGNKVKKTLSDIGLTAKQSHVYQKIAEGQERLLMRQFAL